MVLVRGSRSWFYLGARIAAAEIIRAGFALYVHLTLDYHHARVLVLAQSNTA